MRPFELPPRADREPRSHVRVLPRPYDHEREPSPAPRQDPAPQS